MENIIESLINGNNKYHWEILQENEKIELDQKIPKYPLLILTCMDPQIDVYRIFQLNPGDAFVLRNAGNLYTEDVLRSILIAIHEYNVKFIVVLGHLDCGMKKIRLDNLRYILPSQALKQIGKYSSNYNFALQRFFKPFVDEIANVNNQVDRLKRAKEILYEIKVFGMLYDPLTGWVFHENEFKKFSSYDKFMRNYQELLQQKRMNHVDFLETIESEIVGTQNTKSNEVIEEPENIEILEENLENCKGFNPKTEIGSEAEYKDLKQILEKNAEVIEKSMNIVSKVQIPKIPIPKIRIYVPKVNKYKKEN